MDLKPYQQSVLADLRAFLDCLADNRPIRTAFRLHWQAKEAAGMPAYRDTLPGAPQVCLKVPTGGGKTYLAACALEPIFAWANPKAAGRPRVVVWLAPSRTILRQTLRALRDPEHPYRRAIGQGFENRVAVLDKDEALSGASFSPDAIRDQLTILVLSYDSLKSRTKDNRKLHDENGCLLPFATFPGIDFGDKGAPSVADVLRATAPVVVVDESHNAGSGLSRDMLADLGPSFVLDLTATPKDDANIVGYVDAMALKAAGMVKLPVILRNRPDKDTVYRDAIDLQGQLEREAIAEEGRSGRYIRPIVLFQAESRTGQEDRDTFDKVRRTLEDLEVPADRIAIKTADIDEIGDTDLLVRDCPIRFIITVNALKEGWDCPFAYVLASLADRSSEIDVQQVLGRVLRQPYAREHGAIRLNMSYVLTASEKFGKTIGAIITGLKGAGFSEKDYRIAPGDLGADDDAADDALPFTSGRNLQPSGSPAAATTEEGRSPPAAGTAGNATSAGEDWLAAASREGEDYARSVQEQLKIGGEPADVEARMNRKHMRPELREVASALVLPQFFLRIPAIGFLRDTGREQLLDRANLLENFTLAACDARVGFDALNDDTMEVDIEATEEGSRPRVRVIDMQREREMANLLQSRPREAQVRELTGWVFKLIGRMPPLADPDIRQYIRRVLEAQPAAGLEMCISQPRQCAKRIKDKIAALETTYAGREFERLVGSRDIFPRQSYHLPVSIVPVRTAHPYDRRLYEDEAELNGFEEQVVRAVSSLDNVVFWHKNLSRGHGFCINGPFNHYPDFIIRLRSGATVVLETKGDDRDNTDSEAKLALGRRWADMAGREFSYFMVFDSTDMAGAQRLAEFVPTLRHM